MKKGRIRGHAVLALGAAAYALLYAFCSQIDESGACTLRSALLRFAVALPVALGVLILLFRWGLPRLELAADPPQKAGRPFCTAGAFVLIFCCYVPLFLVEFPGSFMYDIPNQTFQIARGEYNTFHPLLHTLFLRLCLGAYGVLQSLERCAALYSVLQMATMAAIFALLCASVSRSVSRRAAHIATAVFCLYPAHMAFASNCTKDGLFAACFALFLALCLERARCGRLPRGHAVLMVASGMLACMLRNNMIYAMAVWCVLLLTGGRRLWRIAGCGALAIALSCGANAGLVALTDAGEGSVVEMLSVPVQQLARARLLAPERFTEEERETMDAVFPPGIAYSYEPTLADPVKNALDPQRVKEHLTELASLWISVGKKCPEIYLDAFLNLALPSLYPCSAYRVAQPYIEVGLQNGALASPFGLPWMTQPRRFAAVREWIYTHLYQDGADGVPVIRWLFNTGAVYWLLLLLWLYEAYSGRWKRFALLLLPVLLWGTYLLGPVMQGRYLYPFVCALPLFLLRPRETQAAAENA